MKIFKLTFLIASLIFITSCGEAFKYRKVDAKEFPPDPKLRVKKNLEDGKGFRLMDNFNGIIIQHMTLQAQILYGEQPWIF